MFGEGDRLLTEAPARSVSRWLQVCRVGLPFSQVLDQAARIPASCAVVIGEAGASFSTATMVCTVWALIQVVGLPSATLVPSRTRVFSSGSAVHGLLFASAGSSVSQFSSTPHSIPFSPTPSPANRAWKKRSSTSRRRGCWRRSTRQCQHSQRIGT
ncbi:hypothetical protein [Streptomyces sp. NPDC007205]|uniref:hypothetical protein n=1 Tax=Streptomyces sp. NPDC007205 TaxID=3154316 RepID=UPI003403FE6A